VVEYVSGFRTARLPGCKFATMIALRQVNRSIQDVDCKKALRKNRMTCRPVMGVASEHYKLH
jgi:hypothetical protein